MLETIKPNTNAVSGTVVGSALTVIIVWLVKQVWGVEVPGEVAAAGGVVLGAFIGHATGFVQGQSKKEESDEAKNPPTGV